MLRVDLAEIGAYVSAIVKYEMPHCKHRSLCGMIHGAKSCVVRKVPCMTADKHAAVQKCPSVGVTLNRCTGLEATRDCVLGDTIELRFLTSLP